MLRRRLILIAIVAVALSLTAGPTMQAVAAQGARAAAATPAPSTLSAARVSPLAILLTWNYPTPANKNALSYFQISNGSVSRLAPASARGGYWTGINPGEEMCFNIRAVSSAGDSAWFPAAPNHVCMTTPATSSDMRLCDGYAQCSTNGFMTHGYQSNSGTSYWTMDAGNECTNYAAYVESTVYHVAQPSKNLGSADTWANNASAQNIRADDNPSVGAVAQWNGPTSKYPEGGISTSGHVAIVEQVGPNNSYIVISQQDISTDTDGYDWQIIYAGVPSSQYEPWPDNFIHF